MNAALAQKLRDHAEWIEETYEPPSSKHFDKSTEVRARLHEIAQDLKQAAGK